MASTILANSVNPRKFGLLGYSISLRLPSALGSFGNGL